MISIIVPVYNQQAYLDRCVQSILNQSYRDFEVILIDDGSTDSSGHICDSYKAQDDRVVVVHQTNGGLSDARNAGIRLAKGEYICFIDSDDFVDSRMLELLCGNAVKYNADISFANLWWIRENDTIQKDDIRESVEVYRKGELDGLLLSNDFEYNWCIVTAWNKLFRRDLFENYLFETGRLHEDEFLIHRILDKADVLTYSQVKTYYYMKHSESIMGRAGDKSVCDAIDAHEDRLNFWIEKDKGELSKRLAEQLMYEYKGLYYNLGGRNLKNENAVKKYMRAFYRKLVLYNWKYKNISFRDAVRNYLWGVYPLFVEKFWN